MVCNQSSVRSSLRLVLTPSLPDGEQLRMLKRQAKWFTNRLQPPDHRRLPNTSSLPSLVFKLLSSYLPNPCRRYVASVTKLQGVSNWLGWHLVLEDSFSHQIFTPPSRYTPRPFTTNFSIEWLSCMIVLSDLTLNNTASRNKTFGTPRHRHFGARSYFAMV